MPALRIPLDAVSHVGRDLLRCEGVVVARDGAVWAADGRGVCTRIDGDGGVTRVGDLGGEPNGICLDAGGRIVIANIAGSVQRLDPATGRHEVLATRTGNPVTTTPNFAVVDGRGRIWVSNSTARPGYLDAVYEPKGDGFLFRIAEGRVEVVADELWFANGLALDAGDRHLYVAESTAGRITRFPIHPDGSLGPRVRYGPDLGLEFAPDGIAFDEAGNLWVTCPGANVIGVVTPEGAWEIVLHDPNHSVLSMPTNIAFGGPDRRTAYLGNLPGPSLPSFRVPIPGMPLVHQL